MSSPTPKLKSLTQRYEESQQEVALLKSRISLLVRQRNELYDSQATEILLLREQLQQAVTKRL